jgi:hypothetical protein
MAATRLCETFCPSWKGLVVVAKKSQEGSGGFDSAGKEC